MKPPDFLKVSPADVGRAGALGACILAVVRYTTALPGESDRRRVVDGQTWWRGSQDDIGQLLGELHRKSVGRALGKLEAAGELLSMPSKDYGDRAKLYRVSDQPLDESGQSTARKSPLSSDVSGQSQWPEVANLSSTEELEGRGKNARANAPLNDPSGNSETDSGPAAYCRKHPGGTEKPCRDCRVARQSRQKWDAEQAERERTERQAVARARRECTNCDGTGQVDIDEDTVARCPACSTPEARQRLIKEQA